VPAVHEKSFGSQDVLWGTVQYPNSHNLNLQYSTWELEEKVRESLNTDIAFPSLFVKLF
jgi:hypothetical protein